VFSNLGDNAGGGSAYSVFNEGQALPGTFTAQEFEGALRGSVQDAGFAEQQEFVPGYVAEAVYKWLTSKEMGKKHKETTEEGALRNRVQQNIEEDLRKVRAMPERVYGRACRALRLPAHFDRKKTDYTLAIQLNSQSYVSEDTEAILKGYGL
jgi:hypothetical protein